ncbi:hypothetical protein RchiOBHm_Chr3g0479551 [Rosa chinensis]|uniref:Uncharacterized protein n=1 Tax=Rosa chinensis TaxID=74649 RepID=A0A2P6RDF9_ROSCH|nr:hypothetical protein RchiOBHm_Chr3g0479551 [Rosa chinensis]
MKIMKHNYNDQFWVWDQFWSSIIKKQLFSIYILIYSFILLIMALLLIMVLFWLWLTEAQISA